MRLLLDTNILLDVALQRPGLASAGDRVVLECQAGRHQAAVAWHTISNLYYILRAQLDASWARSFLSDLLRWVEVSPTSATSAQQALTFQIPDFEDALQASAALVFRAEYIVTRNSPDFRNSPVRAISPEGFLNLP